MADNRFIPPGENIGAGHPHVRHYAQMPADDLRHRWTAPEGKNLLKELDSRNFDREVLRERLGRLYDHYDLRGAPLAGSAFAGRDLSQIDFYASDLRDADLSRCDLTGTYLSECDISGAKFDWASMDGVLLDNVRYDVRTSFLGVDLNRINFTLAARLHDMAMIQQRISDLRRDSPLLARFLWVTCRYGFSIGLYFAWLAGIIVFFALVYWLVPGLINERGFLASLYFSVATFTTLGYGDIVPASSLGRVIVMVEVIAGYVMGGLLVVIIARRLLLG